MFQKKKELRRKLYAERMVNEKLREDNNVLRHSLFEHRAAEREAQNKCAGVEKALAEALHKNEGFEQEVHKLLAERDDLLRINGDLKREADKQRGENEKLTEQIMHATCPEDCKGHAVSAPGGSYCRACIRNPHARDKYRAVTE